MSGELADVHSFIFHTRVTGGGATRCATRTPGARRSACTCWPQGWGGGTRIGDSLAQFNREHAPRLVHSRTAVLVLSDGYDTGEPEQLAEALARLRRRARRIVWLNPLLRAAGLRAGQPGHAGGAAAPGPAGARRQPRGHRRRAAATAGGAQMNRRDLPLSAVVLAAGQSARMEGRNKLLLPVQGEPLIRRTVLTVLASGVQETVVVTGHQGREVVRELSTCR